MSDNINVEIVEAPINVNIAITDAPQNVSVDVNPARAIWSTIVGTLSTQTDLWSVLSAKALNSDFQILNSFVQANSAQWDETADIIPTIVNFLSTTPAFLSSINVSNQILSANTPLHNIFLTRETDSQTLTYNPSDYSLAISGGNTVNLSLGKFNSASTIVESNSARWNSVHTTVANTSARWDSNFTTVAQASANWNEAYQASTVYNTQSSSYVTNTILNTVSGQIVPVVTQHLATNPVQISSLNVGPLTSTQISLSDLNFTGGSTYAKALTGSNFFVEVKIGNTTKYLQLFDIERAYTYFTDFDGPGEVKPGYASGNVTLSGIQWNLTEALIGTETNEVILGTRSARLRGYGTTTMTMCADKVDGASKITLLYRSYTSNIGVPDSTQVPWLIEYSTDTGTTWTSAGSFTANPTTQLFTSYLNLTGNIRFRFRTTSTGTINRRTNIDNITINPYT